MSEKLSEEIKSVYKGTTHRPADAATLLRWLHAVADLESDLERQRTRIAALEAESVADLVDAGWCVSVHAMPGGRVRAYAERRAKQHAGVDIADVRGDGIAAALDALRAKIGGE